MSRVGVVALEVGMETLNLDMVEVGFALEVGVEKMMLDRVEVVEVGVGVEL